MWVVVRDCVLVRTFGREWSLCCVVSRRRIDGQMPEEFMSIAMETVAKREETGSGKGFVIAPHAGKRMHDAPAEVERNVG